MLLGRHAVVYLLIPTSNHNFCLLCACYYMLYIFWFLHQTTTSTLVNRVNACCISFDSYIKPQLKDAILSRVPSCISFDSYIKPQLIDSRLFVERVVYLLIPTSNHNFLEIPKKCSSVVYLLIPTSNHNVPSVWCRPVSLYIFWFLHQTTTGLN